MLSCTSLAVLIVTCLSEMFQSYPLILSSIVSSALEFSGLENNQEGQIPSRAA